MSNAVGSHVTERLETELDPTTAALIATADHPGPCYGVMGMSYGIAVEMKVKDMLHKREGAVMALDTDGWTWIHPRYRWLAKTIAKR